MVGIFNSQPVHFSGVETVGIDLRDVSAVESLLKETRPRWVIHCAALTDVEACESNPELAFTMNGTVSGQVAAAAAAVDAGIVYVSTDSLWSTPGPHREDDIAAPPNMYARSKLLGEGAVRGANAKSLVIRTNIFGWNLGRRRMLAGWILAQLESGHDIPGFVDVTFNPLLANDLADMLIELTDRNTTGLYHVASSETTTKHAFAALLATEFGYDPSRVKRASIEDVASRAFRPRNSTLAIGRISSLMGRPMPSIVDGVRRLRELRDAGYLDRLNASTSGEWG